LKNLFRFGFLAFAVSSMLLTSCAGDENEELVPDENTDKTYELNLTEGQGDDEVTVYIKDIKALKPEATSFEVVVNFTSVDKAMRRLYMTVDTAGAGAQPYELEIAGIQKKSDGSLNLDKDVKTTFTYALPFDIIPNFTGKTVEYKLWTTTQRGDYRNMQDDLAVGVGTIIVDYDGENPATVVREFSTVILAAPLADGSSQSFMSTLTGEQYEINTGEESAAYWDLGYYYAAVKDGVLDKNVTASASLSSTVAYPAIFKKDGVLVAISGLTGVTDLNNCYFLKSDKTLTDFEGVTNSNQLDNLSVNDKSPEVIDNLSVGDVVAFMDGYGKKGLIYVEEINGKWNSGDYIKINVKVQP